MERISRALEAARAQRTLAVREAVAPVILSDVDPRADSVPVSVAALPAPATPAEPAAPVAPATTELQAAPAPGDSDTAKFRARIVELDPLALERERILSSGAPGPAGSAYKMLRTQVLRRMEQIGATTLAVLSPTAGAGKTLSAINLAIAIAAEEGRTVLLVDFDLRNPSIHRRLGFEVKLGIEECIEQRRPVQHALVKLAGYERLTVLPARSRLEASSELLADERTATLVAELRSRYANRLLIFDMPPVLQADDALAFTRCVQAGLLVVREGHTKREDVTRSIELLRDLKIVGTVLNGSRNNPDVAY
jgi:Mrp family chromosome partitioning ATPase